MDSADVRDEVKIHLKSTDRDLSLTSQKAIMLDRKPIALLICLTAVTPGLGQTDRGISQNAVPDRLPQRMESEHLPNPVRIHPRVISGGLPNGDDAFRELAELGVKTIISVDGAKPDVEGAKKFGLRYVHLPHGYDGVTSSRVNELAKAVRDLDGPIYVHCHHGKHRSPAAASIACVAAGLVPSSQAVAILELAGTDRSYRGLYQSAREVRPVPKTKLDSLEVQFCEVVEVPPMAEAMVQLGHTHDHLRRIADSNWRTPESHPDLAPAHEALLLREHFTELLRTPEVQEESEEFRGLLRESEQAAKTLEDLLTRWQPTSDQTSVPPEIPKQAKRISDNCKACHVTFRDVPLSEK